MKIALNLLLLCFIFSAFISAEGPLYGNITNEDEDAISNISLEFSGDFGQITIFSETGAYSISDLPPSNVTQIRPFRNDNHLNGVSLFDIILISRHILQIQKLDSPYKMIAADVNNDNIISIADLIAVRRLILNLDTEFPDNSSWRFIDKSYAFPNVANPWEESFPESITLQTSDDSPVGGNFIGVKIGDVSGDASLE